MRGLVPGIHVLAQQGSQGVDGRDEGLAMTVRASQGVKPVALQPGSVRSAAVELDRIGGSGRTLAAAAAPHSLAADRPLRRQFSLRSAFAAAAAAHAVDIGSAGVEILGPLRTAFGTTAAAHAIAGIETTAAWAAVVSIPAIAW